MVRSAADMEAGQAAEGAALAAVAAAATNGRAGGGSREPEGLPCPRCESANTKFCYYNNYNLSQPRYFCRACRRYWTRGGALRNVPVGGGTRKATPAARRKHRSGSGAAPASPTPPLPVLLPPPLTVSSSSHGAMLRPYGIAFPALASPSPLAALDPDRRLLDLGGSFSSLIAAAGPVPDGGGAHFSAGFLVGGFAPALAHGPPPPLPPATLPPPPPPPQQQQQQHQHQVSQALPEGLIWSMGWPDLSI